MSYAQDLDQRIHEAIAANDGQALQNMLDQHYQKSETTKRPYDAALELRAEYQQALAADAFEGDAAMNWANKIDRAIRLVAYKTKVAFGFSGTRIVAEGDSWFQYPLLLTDVIDNFMAEGDFAVFSLGAAGDLVEHMAMRREYHKALSETGAKVMLFSGGGNDLLGNGRFEGLLNSYTDGASAKDLVNQPVLENTAKAILGYYQQILHDVLHNHPGVTVFGHGYDTPFPMAGEKYFGVPFENAGIPLDLGRQVIEEIVDYFRSELSALTQKYPNYRFINLKGTVGDHPKSWDDELHPENAGFKRAAAPMIKAVRDHIATLPPSDSFEHVFEHTTMKSVVLDPGHGGTLTNGGSSWNNAIGPSGSLEKTWTLDVCKRAKTVMEMRGYTVSLTRENDINPTLAERRDVAVNIPADAFISVHFNASTAHNAQGTETYIHKTAKHTGSIKLMRTVQASMVSALGHTDRNATRTVDGILRGAYGVINEGRHAANTAACLLEVSFMDRINEEKRIKQATYRDRIAKAIADGVEAYFDDHLELNAIADAFEFGDAIEISAAENGFTVPQYLGIAQIPDDLQLNGNDGAFEMAIAPDTNQQALMDGSMLAPDPVPEQGETEAQSSIIQAILAEHIGSSSDRENNTEVGEQEGIDASQAIDFESLASDLTKGLPVLRRAFSGFESSGFDYDAFSSLINGLGLRYFTPREFIYLGAGHGSGHCKGKNTPPAEHLWNNIIPTALMLDEIRHRLGTPVRILSGYRNKAYNDCIGGTDSSLHMQFKALDWTCDTGNVSDWQRVANEVRKEKPEFAGGIGRYDTSRFIHIDTRGHNADWRV